MSITYTCDKCGCLIHTKHEKKYEAYTDVEMPDRSGETTVRPELVQRYMLCRKCLYAFENHYMKFFFTDETLAEARRVMEETK